MQTGGVVEIIAGLIVVFHPLASGWIVTLWLGGQLSPYAAPTSVFWTGFWAPASSAWWYDGAAGYLRLPIDLVVFYPNERRNAPHASWETFRHPRA